VSEDVIKEDKQLNYILVEGSDDAQVFFHLLRSHNLENRINIQKKEGIENLLEGLEVELMRRAETRLAIIVDADFDLAARWQSLRNKLIHAGYADVPLQPDPQGTILQQDGRPVVGLWLMPNNTLPGMLEDFMGYLVPTNDVLWPMAADVVQQVITKDRRFPLMQLMKAHIHTWLAWQQEPGKPMGQAITKHYLNAAAPQAQQLIDWLRMLFDFEKV
jgi:hypothetical protein